MSKKRTATKKKTKTQKASTAQRGPSCESITILSSAQELFGELWPSYRYDHKLRMATEAVLDYIGALGFMAKIPEFESTLFCPAPVKGKPGINSGYIVGLKNIGHRELDLNEDAMRSLLLDRAVTKNMGDYLMLKVAVGETPTKSPNGRPYRSRESMIGVLFYQPSDAFEKLFNQQGFNGNIDANADRFASSVGISVVQMLLDAFRNRGYRFAAFAPRLRQEYWDDAVFFMDRTRTKNEIAKSLQPPWDRSERMVKTATISLDLRKSTYCMEFARSEADFGHWLDHLNEKMRAVAHLHGGVFDKFTGDGALIHFLQNECSEIYKDDAVNIAVHCAIDLQRAIEIHMKKLREILHHDSPAFGAGIAIDVGNAFWSCDHRNNPIVVGKGVVGACRVGDKAPKRTIRLTNLAYQELSDSLRQELSTSLRDEQEHIRPVPLQTKESPGGFELSCWEFPFTEKLTLGKGDVRIRELCEEVRRRFEKRAYLSQTDQ